MAGKWPGARCASTKRLPGCNAAGLTATSPAPAPDKPERELRKGGLFFVIGRPGCPHTERMRVRILLQALFTLQNRFHLATAPGSRERAASIAVCGLDR